MAVKSSSGNKKNQEASSSPHSSQSPDQSAARRRRIPVSDSELAEKKRLVLNIIQNLEATYGVQINNHRDDPLSDPLSELILTILSQATSDTNSRRAFENLRRRFQDWETVRRARTSSIASAIKSGGLANAKSVTIKNALNEIKNRRGNLELSFLQTADIEEGRKFLTSITGVGPKTAACVLLFACDREVFPMDTHILRITKRVGLVPGKSNDEQAHRLMEKLIPPKMSYSLHINLIKHGRRICRPQNPKCDRCSLVELCDFGRSKL